MTVPSKSQTSSERQLICRNLTVDGDCISYAVNEQNGVGLYVSKENEGQYNEIEILALKEKGSIAIGVVPSDYPENLLPGLGYKSMGYHSDGKLYFASATDKMVGQAWRVGDRIGCKIVEYGDRDNWKVTFTHNGREIGSEYVLGHLFAVGMKADGDKVKVILSD